MFGKSILGTVAAIAALTCAAGSVHAQSVFGYGSGKLLLTGGVSQVEGSAGGGLTPWAVIGGYEASDQIGGNAFYTDVDTQDYDLKSSGVLVGFYDRVEVSYAQQDFDMRNVSAALGLGYGYRLKVDTLGVKVRLLGNAVLDQDEWLSLIHI